MGRGNHLANVSALNLLVEEALDFEDLTVLPPVASKLAPALSLALLVLAAAGLTRPHLAHDAVTIAA